MSMVVRPPSSSFEAVTQALPGPDEIGGFDVVVRQPEGERADGLGAAGNDNGGVDPEEARRAPGAPGSASRPAPAGEATTIELTPATWAGTTAITSDDG